jgi:hypothetical protein
LLVFSVALSGISLLDEVNSCAHVLITNRSCGVVIARLRSSVRSLLHQYRDFHQLTYLYLTEDREPMSHQVVSDFRLLVRYFHVLYSKFLSLYQAPPKKPKKNYTLSAVLYPLELQFLFVSRLVEFVFIVIVSCCWFEFVFVVCSTPLHAFGCATDPIPPIQQQTDPMHSSVCPACRLVLILHVVGPR